MRYSQGFTLIEIAVVVAIVAIIATVAVPSFQRIIAINEVSSVANSISGSLALARAESIKRNARIRVIPADAEGPNGFNATDWSSGIWIWNDLNGDLVPDVSDSATAEILNQLVRPGLNLQISGPTAAITFLGNGFSNAASSIKICHVRYPELGRRFNVTASGQVTSFEEDCNG